jgi:hypothetical protein
MKPGKFKLSLWFSLSYASWLTIPRVLMEEMPDDWQSKMADLLSEYDEIMSHVNSQYDLETSVSVKKKGKFAKMPRELCNYRRPDKWFLDLIQRRC